MNQTKSATLVSDDTTALCCWGPERGGEGWDAFLETTYASLGLGL